MSHCLIGSDPRWLNYLGTLKRETQQASLIDTPTHKHTHTAVKGYVDPQPCRGLLGPLPFFSRQIGGF